MYPKALLPDTFRAIQLVSRIPPFQNAYLAGGTALALLIGHRISVDLDFFTPEAFDENELHNLLMKIPGFKEKRRSWRTILGNIGETKVSIFFYQYPLIETTGEFEGIQVAGKKDLAAMKVNALESRGTRRDFIDLFFLSKEYSVEAMLEFYDQKYTCLEDHLYSIIRSLHYFEDAEKEEIMPKMLIETSWDKVKEFFQQETIRLAKEKLNIPGL